MHLLTLLSLSAVALGAALPRQATSAEPCADLVSLYNASAQPGDSAQLLDSQIAQDCLSSIPFYSDLATKFMAEFRKHVAFQSTLEILANPPDTYESKAVDILRGLDEIDAKVETGHYSSHYEFETEVALLISSANDGHFSVRLCTTGLFSFSLGEYGLVSVSTTGIDLPQLYVLLNGMLVGGTDEATPITSINGQNATNYITQIAEYQGFQDLDVRYNSLFLSYAAGGSGSTTPSLGSFSFNSGLWPGSNVTVIDFEDGSTLQIPTIVSVSFASSEGIKDGQSLFQSTCIPSPTSEEPSSTTSPVEPEVTTEVSPETEPEPSAEPSAEPSTLPSFTSGPLGYPESIVRDGYNQVNGFYLDNDTAVMFIPTFETDNAPANDSLNVAEIAAGFIYTARNSGHSRLIIDLTGNGGGDITRAFTLFSIFFPAEIAYSATRFRRHPASELVSKVLGTLNETEAAKEVDFVYQYAVTPDQHSGFPTLASYLTTITEHGVPVSALHANFNNSAYSSEESPIYGYGPFPITNKTAPYAPEDILIITDGYCSSTCTTFVNLMSNVGQVPTLAFGGRPLNAPMQIMGGVRGGQAMQADGVSSFFAVTAQQLQVDPSILSAEELQLANDTAPLPLAAFPVVVTSLGVNLRNAYQEGDDDLPLQFQYQAADCRLFYTLENYLQPSTVWQAAKDAVWGGGGCVPGSTGGKGSLADRAGNGTAGRGWSGWREKSSVYGRP
ncbi:uncharacterized protein HMPREF1541_09992 [Cyphellophora europaea CBS 101466]|uniref:CPAF-like PDZ domain-containing protein n=1 Tax=Cyphellophora europaea (strain CBS 101466) TaxID=1220924 RepID=W2S8Z6_CYPE1|nr:uncharacterized protein HMPREF1541_09992 [Cyphellophora europaea CBS 101466]ETN45115.1 hypothetical protein HMPREF1541_09992 [Cyphellophora europaea CBS 101466]